VAAGKCIDRTPIRIVAINRDDVENAGRVVSRER
jgi:hypothetical protein